MPKPPLPPDAPRVVIVGGGFGGLYAAKALRQAPVRVTVVDRRNHHLFQPLLYQVATASLSASDIAQPIRTILKRQANATTLLAEVTGFDLARRELLLADDCLPYDYLILAPGAVNAYFGHDAWEGLAPGLKSVEDALEIRRRVFLAFEAAEREDDPAARAALLTFVVVGGGPTGVELAGALAEIARYTLPREFRAIDPSEARIVLVDGGTRVLATFPDRLGRRAGRDLERLGVELRLGTRVTGIEPDAVLLGPDRERLPTRTVLWGAGVAASPLAAMLGAEIDGGGRVRIEPDLSLPGHPEVFVVGDAAAAVDRRGRPLPGTAPVAIQQGRWAAANIERVIAGQTTLPFRYRDRGVMATIGRNAGVAVIGGVQLSGIVAWVAWALVHVFSLIGFRNRVAVMLEWMWAYLTRQRSARLITQTPSPRLRRAPAQAGAIATPESWQ